MSIAADTQWFYKLVTEEQFLPDREPLEETAADLFDRIMRRHRIPRPEAGLKKLPIRRLLEDYESFNPIYSAVKDRMIRDIQAYNDRMVKGIVANDYADLCDKLYNCWLDIFQKTEKRNVNLHLIFEMYLNDV